MNDITKQILQTTLPYIVTFILGVLVCLMFRGCGSAKVETKIIEKPIPKIEYVDRWKTDTVRFVSTRIVERVDTIYQNKVVNRLDTLLLIDTVKIVETWLTELVSYDSTVTFDKDTLRLRWQNYQNFSENVRIDFKQNAKPLKWALGIHGNAGLISDFKTSYVPLFGLGLQTTIKKSYIAADYGFNGNHYVGLRVGYNFIQK